MKKKIIYLMFLPMISLADGISVQQYLDLAKGKDPSLVGSEKMKTGSEEILNSASLLTGLNLTAGVSYLSDGRPTVNPAFQGSKTLNSSYSVGLQQQTDFGLAWNLSQNFSYTKINDASLLQMPEYYDAYPKLELTLPLWRNWMGVETSSAKDSLSQQLKAQKLSAELNEIQKINEIKEAYYTYLTQIKNYEIQKDSLARAEKILSWAQSRVNRNLSDKSDLYQTQALVASRKLELISADNKKSEARRQFENFIPSEDRKSEYELSSDGPDVERLNTQKKEMKSRIDLILQKENLKASQANYLAQSEKNKPNLNLSMAVSRTGRDSTSSGAQSNMTAENKDYFLVAVNFVMPLDIGTWQDAKNGYQQLALSQRLSQESITKSEKITWQNMIEQCDVLSKQLLISKELEVIQKNKADLERSKYNNGRSTTYQVLNFEQDYMNARNQRINLELQIQKFVNSLDLYK